MSGLTRVKRLVVDRWKISPLNSLRWNATLSCGHDVWVNGKRKPIAKMANCDQCAALARLAEKGEG